MKVYIKVWPNGSATIMTSNGQVVWTFSSAAEARQACTDWCGIVEIVDCDHCEYPDDEAASLYNLA